MRLSLISILFIGLPASGCLGLSAMDALGREEAVTEARKNRPAIEDDRIEDKHPVYDPDRTVDEVFGDYCVVRLNKSGAVTRLDIAKPVGADEALMSTPVSVSVMRALIS